MSERRKTMIEPLDGLGQAPDAPRPRTMLEPIDANILSGQQPKLTPLPMANADARSAGTSGTDRHDRPRDCELYRPTMRPPLARLCILDDGSPDRGEVIRIRTEQTIIGRGSGSILIPHDGGMSSQHAEIVRQVEGGAYRWYLRDLNSTNGTFVRCGKATLRQDQEVMIGAKRYYFQQAKQAGESAPPAHNSTQAWQAVTSDTIDAMYAALVERLPNGDGQRFPLTTNDILVGSDAATCHLTITNDPFVSQKHARIVKGSGGQWTIKNIKSVNGLWTRITKVAMDCSCEFQLGEQRFRFDPM